jgi:hypothetical protein
MTALVFHTVSLAPVFGRLLLFRKSDQFRLMVW